MNQRQPGRPVRILFQQMTEATIRKIRSESADAHSGGGARDLRLSPHEEVAPFMEALLPAVRVGRRAGRGGAEDTEIDIHWGTATWGDGSREAQIEYWPPTDTRPTEGRIARINSLPPLADPPQDLDGAVVLFVQDDNGALWVRYATAAGLRRSLPEIADTIRECLARAAGLRIASGYIDLSEGGLGTWCNAELLDADA